MEEDDDERELEREDEAEDEASTRTEQEENVGTPGSNPFAGQQANVPPSNESLERAASEMEIYYDHVTKDFLAQ